MAVKRSCRLNKGPHSVQNGTDAYFHCILEIVPPEDSQRRPEAVRQWLFVLWFVRISAGTFPVDGVVDLVRAARCVVLTLIGKTGFFY
jgi:hypothetical protein